MHERRHFTIVSVCILTILLVSAGGFVAKNAFESRNHSGLIGQTNVPPPPKKTALSCVRALSNDMKIGQKIMAAGYSNQLVSSQPAFVQNGIGGVILMNETSSEIISEFQHGFSVAPFIGVDQEGGTVQRYTSEGFVPGASNMATNFTTAEAYQKYLADAQYLKSVGITVNFGPVVDVKSVEPSPLPGRMYSSNPFVVVQYAAEFINASQKVGVTPVLKHFPGLGSATGNTDDVSATTDLLSSLKTRDLLPYQQLAQFEPDVMVSNAITPGLTDGQPAVWSSAAVSLLRSYGYQDAVIYSDSLTAEAMTGTIEDAVIKAWQAGIDVALFVQDPGDVTTLSGLFQSIRARATTALQNGELNDDTISESALRILERKKIDPCSIEPS